MKSVLPFSLLILLMFQVEPTSAQSKSEPVSVAVIGLTHTHVHWILGRPDQGDLKIVGIVEKNRELAERYSKQHGFSMDIVYSTDEEMLRKIKPQAVFAFGSIYDHLKVVETYAPLGIHIMVEKPLAVSYEHAKRMSYLAERHDILLLTNYETSWYATNHAAAKMLWDGKIGSLRKVVIHDGHQGPVEIGVNKEFLEWLTNPKLNGGGALTDFGCYGANLLTWLQKGERPISVTAVTQTIKPDIYPEVDDEATIIVTYPTAQGIIQASWNWPVSRKDMEVYGKHGYVISENRRDLRFRLSEKEQETKKSLEELENPYNDPFSFFVALINQKIEMPEYDLSSLENNMLVVEILDAARKSASTGQTIYLDD